jgi:hypothetical protein
LIDLTENLVALLLELLDHVHHFDLELLDLGIDWSWRHCRSLSGSLGLAVGLVVGWHAVAILLHLGVHHELVEHAWELHHHFLLVVHIHVHSHSGLHCHHWVHHGHGRHLLLDWLFHLGSSTLLADHGLDSLLAIFAVFLRGNRVGEIDFLNIFLGDSWRCSVFLGFVGLDSGGDFWLDFHENDLLAVGSEAVVLLAEAEEGGPVGLFHLSEIGSLIVSLVVGSLVKTDDHPALEANSGLQLADGWNLEDSQVTEQGDLGVELGGVNVHDWPGGFLSAHFWELVSKSFLFLIYQIIQFFV